MYALRALSIVVLATGCMVGDEDDYEPAVPDDVTSVSAIVGEVNWMSTTRLPISSPEAKVASAVGYLALPAKGSRCTAWLIDQRRVVTNNHCVGSAEDAVGARVSFNYVNGVATADRVWYDCPPLVATWSDIDAAVLRCNRKDGAYPGDVQGFLSLGEANPAANSTLYVIHQNCDKYNSPGCAPTKKISRGTVLDATHTGAQFTHGADTLGGSSGAPVLASTGKQAHKVVGLHRAALGKTEDGRGTKNLARQLTALKQRLAEIGL
jgi:V8-like Glu-specific endopeptidase